MKLKSKIEILTHEQSDTIFELFAEIVKQEDVDVDDLEEYFKIENGELCDNLRNFFTEEMEYESWFDYAIHGQLVVNDVQTYIEFYKDEDEWAEDGVAYEYECGGDEDYYDDEEGEEWGDED